MSFKVRAPAEGLGAFLAWVILPPLRVVHLLVLLAVGAPGECFATLRAL